MMKTDKGAGPTSDRPRGGLPGRHVPAVRGHGVAQRLRPDRDLRRVEVAGRGRPARARATAWTAGTAGSSAAPASTWTSRSAKYSASATSRSCCYGEPEKIKVEGVNLTYEGVLTKVKKSMLSKDVEAMQPHVRRFVERAVTFTTCPDCERHPAEQGGAVLEDQRQEHRRAVRDADQRPGRVAPRASTSRRVAPLLAGLQHLLDSFAEIGLGYLSLDRPAGTLSGGEAQRTKMIRHLGSSLTDVTYVFDEPTIGLHPHDIERMNQLLLQLRDKGNTVLVVEHKPETIAIADHVVDLGPGAGTRRRRGAASRAPSRGCAGATPSPGGTSTTGPRSRTSLRERDRGARGARRLDPQPAATSTSTSRSACCASLTGVAGSGKSSLIHGLGRRARRRGGRRPGRDQGLAPEQPGDVHRAAGADPQGVRQGERREAGAVQRQLRGRLPGVQRRRRDLHRARA